MGYLDKGTRWTRGVLNMNPKTFCYVNCGHIHIIVNATRASDVILAGDVIEVDFGDPRGAIKYRCESARLHDRVGVLAICELHFE